MPALLRPLAGTKITPFALGRGKKKARRTCASETRVENQGLGSSESGVHECTDRKNTMRKCGENGEGTTAILLIL